MSGLLTFGSGLEQVAGECCDGWVDECSVWMLVLIAIKHRKTDGR
jgi:hypothetical protein